MPHTTKRDEPARFAQQDESVRRRKPDPTALSELLDEWMHGDETEQWDTFEILQRGLDEGRPEGYKFFP